MRGLGSLFLAGRWRRARRQSDAAWTARGALGAVVGALPKGQLLPDRAWEQRHRWIVAVVGLHAVGLAVLGIVQGFGFVHGLLEASIVASAAAMAAWRGASRGLRSVAASFGLVTSSALLVHLWGGQIEGHFHFFFVVAVLTLYQDWLPFLLAIAFVVVHHGALARSTPARSSTTRAR